MRRMLVAAAATLGIVGGSAAAGHADETVVVPGTSFPSGSTYLTYFGCTDLYHADTRGPETRIVRDAAAPAGRRTATLTLPGAGTASGPVSLVTSVASATSRLSVSASAGSQGVAYVWFVSPELAPGEVWAGRADLVTSGEGWQQVDATVADYTWTRLEAETGTVLDEPGDATIADFTADHGDGPGYLLTGFGCDGQDFGLDRLKVGVPGSVTTYDLEGWDVSTSITTSRKRLAGGQQARVIGTSTDPWGRVMGEPLQLQARPEGAARFEPVADPVAAGPGGTVVARVTPEVTTDYRWVFADTAYADRRRSGVVRVKVEQATPTQPETPEPTAGAGPEAATTQQQSPPAQEPAPDEQVTEQPVPDLPSGDEVTEEAVPEEPAPTEAGSTTEPSTTEPSTEEPSTEEQPTQE